MYIIIRKGTTFSYITYSLDLLKLPGWTIGSIMAQVGHGVCKILELHRSSTNLSNYLQEVNSMTKVVLSVKNQPQLVLLQKELSEQGIFEGQKE